MTRLEQAYFDDLYAADPDPWRFASSEYEKAKYAHTVEVLEDRKFARALEIGCSIGVLTRQLAVLCDDLVAVDISESAVRAADDRTADLDHVTVQRRSLPEQMPEGPFDLIVASEVLYYWDEALLDAALDALVSRLPAGGLLLAVHWTEPTQDYPLQGDEVHAIVRAHAGLATVRTAVRPHYRLDLMARR